MIDKFTKPMGSATKEIQKAANQYKKAGSQIQSAGKSIANVGANMTKKITLPIVAAGGAAIKLASDFEEGMSKVQSISGATSEDMEKLSNKAKEMGAKTKFSAKESADAFSYMAMAGWKTEDMLDGIEGIMYLAGSSGTDLAQTSDIVTDALTAFGLSAKDSGRLADVMSAASANANTNVEMLGSSFQKVAPIAGAMGYSVEDISTALGVMANTGIKAETAGTSLKNLITNMSAPTKEMKDVMDQLGISLTDSNGNMKDFKTVTEELRNGFSGLSESEKTANAKILAGKTGMAGLLAIVNSSDSDFNKLSDAINNSSSAAQKMYDVANNNLNGQLTVLKSTVESIGISFGEKLAPHVKKVTEFIQKAAEKFNGLSDSQQNTIIKILGIAAAIGPALLVFGKITDKIGGTIKNLGKMGGAIAKAGGLMKWIASPAGIVIGILAAIVVVGILVVKNWDKIKAAAKKLGTAIKGAFQKSGASTEKFKETFSKVKDSIGSIVNNLGIIFGKIVKKAQPIVKFFGGLFKTGIVVAFHAVIGAASGLFTGISGIVSGIIRVFDGIIKFVTGVFTGDWSKAWDGVKDIFGGAFDALVSLCKTPINAVIGIINGAISGINKLGIKVPDWVPVIGGKGFSINIPTIPMLAKGTDNWKGGTAMIHDKGAEIVDLPQGSRVIPHDESLRIAKKQGSRAGGSITIAKIADQIVVREEADIDKITNKLAKKLEDISKRNGGVAIGSMA